MLTTEDEDLPMVPVRTYEYVGGGRLYEGSCPEPVYAATILDPRNAGKRVRRLMDGVRFRALEGRLPWDPKPTYRAGDGTDGADYPSGWED